MTHVAILQAGPDPGETWASQRTNHMKARPDATSAQLGADAALGFHNVLASSPAAYASKPHPSVSRRRLSIPAKACQNKSVPSHKLLGVDGVPSCAAVCQYRFGATDDCTPPCVLVFNARI